MRRGREDQEADTGSWAMAGQGGQAAVVPEARGAIGYKKGRAECDCRQPVPRAHPSRILGMASLWVPGPTGRGCRPPAPRSAAARASLRGQQTRQLQAHSPLDGGSWQTVRAATPWTPGRQESQEGPGHGSDGGTFQARPTPACAVEHLAMACWGQGWGEGVGGHVPGSGGGTGPYLGRGGRGGVIAIFQRTCGYRKWISQPVKRHTHARVVLPLTWPSLPPTPHQLGPPAQPPPQVRGSRQLPQETASSTRRPRGVPAVRTAVRTC